MTERGRLAALESQYLAARTARDRLDVARVSGDTSRLAALEAEAVTRSTEVHEELGRLAADDIAGLPLDDREAIERMRTGLAAADVYELPSAPAVPDEGCDDPTTWRLAIAAGGEPLRRRVEGCFAAAAETLPAPDGPMTRLGVLDRLALEPDRGRRRELFLALEPLWRVVDGDGHDASPYRRMVRDWAEAPQADGGHVGQNMAALGVTRDEVESWALTALAAWRAAIVEPARAAGEPPPEPWDWWWRAGAARRLVGALPLDEALAVDRAVHASLGASLDDLNVRFDIAARPDRPTVPLSFTTFGARPHRSAAGWDPGEPVVVAAFDTGGLSRLSDLVHETGHAIHIAGIRTRPAFADWPDGDAFTEAVADIVAFDVAEPAWQRRWLPGRPTVPEPLSLRCHYAVVVLDSAWALFETRLLANPRLRPNDVWTEITSTWLGIAPHPEWSWWAIRAQLVQGFGGMVDYALGAVLTTELRAAIRDRRGPWIDGDPGWYPWVRDRLYRFGLERRAGDVIRDLLGRPPRADALLTEIARAARAPRVV